MPAKKSRELRYTEKKLRPVPKRISHMMAARHGKKNTRFYYDLQGNTFAIDVTKPKKTIKHWTVCVMKGAPEKKLKPHAIADFRIFPTKDLFISLLTKLGGLSDILEKDRGEMVFRAVLNEAIRIAKREKTNISITAFNARLAEYYKRFGFKFNNPEDPVSGKLTLFKEREKP